MRLQIFAVYDAAVKAYLPPIFVRSRGEAVRSFMDACNQEGSNFAKHASDYTLFALGEYDDSSASFVAGVAPERVIGAIECVADPFTEENRSDDSATGGKVVLNGKAKRVTL